MSTFLKLFLVGSAANLDNLGVGVAYGVRRISVPPLPNLVIATIAFLFTLMSVYAGSSLGRFLSPVLANLIGAILLIGVGIWMIGAQWRKSETRNPQPLSNPPSVLAVWQSPVHADFDRSGVISLREALILGVALSMNCFTNGFAAGLWKLGAIPTALSTAIFSYLSLWGSSALGIRCPSHWLGSKATVVAGCLLILLGLHQLL